MRSWLQCFKFGLDKHRARRCLGTRALLSEQDEVQQAGHEAIERHLAQIEEKLDRREEAGRRDQGLEATLKTKGGAGLSWRQA